MDRTLAAVARQLSAMQASHFKVGIFNSSSQNSNGMWLREYSPEGLAQAVPFLKAKNSEGRHIYVAPTPEHTHLTLIDDLNNQNLANMRKGGFQPAAVIETSPGNFQAWLNHGTPLSADMGKWVAQRLARQFGGDPSSAGHWHMGRLAGFTNRKEKYDKGGGVFPFVLLHETRLEPYDRAAAYIAEQEKALALSLKRTAERVEEQRKSLNGFSARRELRGIEYYRNQTRDDSRSDFLYSLYAVARGVSDSEIESSIRRTRDLEKKGSLARQDDYLRRTIRNAHKIVDRNNGYEREHEPQGKGVGIGR